MISPRFTNESYARCTGPCCLGVPRYVVRRSLPNATVEILYEAPDGTVTLRNVNTDADGCFVDFLPVEPVVGRWQTKVELPETDCRDGDLSGPFVVDVSLDPDGRECVELREKLTELTDKLEQVIEDRDDENVKEVFNTIVRILREADEECQEFAAGLAPRYEELVSAYFQGDEERVKSLIEEIRAILNG